MKKLLLSVGILAAGFSLAACKPTGDGDGSTPNTPPPSAGDEAEITFSAGDGAFSDGKKSVKLTADSNGKVSMTDAPVCDGYAFIGWYSGDDLFDSNTAYDDDCTFTARYVSGNTESVYNALFDEESTVSIDINMSDAEWKKLNHDYIVYKDNGNKCPIYRLADSVTIGIDDGDGMLYYYYEEVGVRMKGNTSRHEFYNNDGFYDNIHMKLSFKQTFDDVDDGYTANEVKPFADKWAADAAGRTARKARMFGGMEKIDIKYNSTYDESYIRELYAMKLFRENGIIAPHVTLGHVSALEKDTTMRNLGVYRIHETIDEAFITRHIEDDVGDLYKCTWGNQGGNGSDLTDDNLEYRVGVNDELNGKIYAYEKKTNKKKDKTTGKRDFSSIINFIRNINDSNKNPADYIDADLFAKFEAVNYILGNPDCIRNHANNYYLYFRKSDGKAIIIPYDYDRCLGSREWDCYDGMTSSVLGPYTRRTTLDGGGLQNPLYKRLIVKGAPTDVNSVLMNYRKNLLRVAQFDMLKASAFNGLKDGYKAHYGKYTSNAINNSLSFDQKKKFDDNKENISYADYINAKLQVLTDNIDDYIDNSN